MSQLVEAFTLGMAAILTNACMLPLYPGLLAFLAGSGEDARARRAMPVFGVLVLAGILTMMLLIGLILFVIQGTFGAVLGVLLPLIYAVVIVMGILLLTGRSPFARLSMGSAPLLQNPYGAAFAYGLLFGPMTLPCTGPIITGAFVLAANGAAPLGDGLLYFLAFGLGFGWPLALLPLAAIPVQRRLIGWLTTRHALLNRAAGILLIAIGIFGFITELLPVYLPDFEVPPPTWALYWGATALLIAAVWALSARRLAPRA